MRTENHDTGDRSVVLSLHFDPDGLTTTTTPFGVIVELADLKSGGEPGAPALPRTQLSIAVPEPLWPGSLKIIEENWERVSDSETVVVPAQHLRAGAARRPTQERPPKHDEPRDDEPKDGCHCAADCTCRTPQRPDRAPVAEGLPSPEMTPPNPDAYAALAENPPPVVRAVRIDTIGSTRVAVIEVAPLRIGRKGELELCTRVQLAIETVEEAPLVDRDRAIAEFKELYGDDFDEERVIPQPERTISGLAEATRWHDIALAEVINPEIVGKLSPRWPVIELPSEYLIITDDVTWNAATITPGAARPGMIAAFQRLAQAKRARGVTARVVSITDIVAGRWGDVRSGSRDLQEVIRRFLKIARDRWGVNWLLLGGDTSIVPVRQVAGSMLGGVGAPGTANPPADNASFWTGSHLNIHGVSLGDWWGASTMNQLVRPDTGALIPYDAAGTSSSTSPGWYFTTADDYATRSATATNFVRVEGPPSLVNSALQFLYVWNTLPTDFYYASLNSWVWRELKLDFGFFTFTIPYVYVPAHDWDANGNGIYGQHHSDGTDIDGVILHADLSVGRAPVETAAEATTFVDKTLAYERLGGFAWSPADRNWPRKMLLAASDWGGRIFFGPTANATPANGQYFHDSAQSRSLLKKDAAPDSFAYDLIARVSENDRRLLPFKSDPNSAVRGWYFATSATNAAPSRQTIDFFFGSISWPVPSPWIVVHGSVAERTPQVFEFDPTGPEGSMDDQETLRRQVRTEVPGIDRYDRYYEDEFDLSFFARIAAPVDFLTESKLRSGLNAAPHFVSLSGHGSGNGCCALSVNVASTLTNGPLGFIGYADSCLTNQFDSQDSMSEALLKNPNGGAVAYVGNTRFSWIGVGDNFQRAFFHRLAATRHLGLLNDSRLSVFGTSGYWAGYDRWAIFALNLLGDPELRVYRAALPGLILETASAHLRQPVIRIVVEQQVPVGPPIPGDPGPVEGVLVHVQQGEREFAARTDADGLVYLPEGMFDEGELEVTASHDDYAVVSEFIPVEA